MFLFQTKVRSDFFSEVPIGALTPQSTSTSASLTTTPSLLSSTRNSQDVVKVRSKSTGSFSARKIVSDSKEQSVYLPTLSERLDSAETGFGRISDTPKRVSFKVGFSDGRAEGRDVGLDWRGQGGERRAEVGFKAVESGNGGCKGGSGVETAVRIAG